MIHQQSYETLLYQHEVLRSRLKIREHYLKTVVREVYENIGQILCLIRVQLASFRSPFETGQKDAIESSGELVGKTIRDLRGMCKLLYPEQDIINGAGFADAFVQELKAQFPEVECSINMERPVPVVLSGEKGVILFSLLLELFLQIKEEERGSITTAGIDCSAQHLTICMNYTGEKKERGNLVSSSVFTDLSIFDRAALVGGSLQIKNEGHGRRRIKLEVPIN